MYFKAWLLQNSSLVRFCLVNRPYFIQYLNNYVSYLPSRYTYLLVSVVAKIQKQNSEKQSKNQYQESLRFLIILTYHCKSCKIEKENSKIYETEQEYVFLNMIRLSKNYNSPETLALHATMSIKIYVLAQINVNNLVNTT